MLVNNGYVQFFNDETTMNRDIQTQSPLSCPFILAGKKRSAGSHGAEYDSEGISKASRTKQGVRLNGQLRLKQDGK